MYRGKVTRRHRRSLYLQSQEKSNPRPQKRPTILTHWFQTSSLQDWEKINFCCLRQPLGGACYCSTSKQTPKKFSLQTVIGADAASLEASQVALASAGDPGLVPGLGRSLGEGNGTPLQYSCLGNPMDRGAWWATVHGVAKGQIQLSDWACMHTHFLIRGDSPHFIPETGPWLLLHYCKSTAPDITVCDRSHTTMVPIMIFPGHLTDKPASLLKSFLREKISTVDSYLQSH